MERRIYYFGRNAAMMALVGQQLAAAGMDAEGFMNEEELAARLSEGHARMLVIGGGVEQEPRNRVKQLCEKLGVLVLEHSAGPQSLPDSISDVLG